MTSVIISRKDRGFQITVFTFQKFQLLNLLSVLKLSFWMPLYWLVGSKSTFSELDVCQLATAHTQQACVEGRWSWSIHTGCSKTKLSYASLPLHYHTQQRTPRDLPCLFFFFKAEIQNIWSNLSTSRVCGAILVSLTLRRVESWRNREFLFYSSFIVISSLLKIFH